jgi:hypothetical protein
MLKLLLPLFVFSRPSAYAVCIHRIRVKYDAPVKRLVVMKVCAAWVMYRCRKVLLISYVMSLWESLARFSPGNPLILWRPDRFCRFWTVISRINNSWRGKNASFWLELEIAGNIWTCKICESTSFSENKAKIKHPRSRGAQKQLSNSDAATTADRWGRTAHTPYQVHLPVT